MALHATRAIHRTAPRNAADEQAALREAPRRRVVPYLQTSCSRVLLALRTLRLTPSDRFVDLGCGDGRLALAAAADFGAHAVGIDVAPSLLRVCRRAARAAGCDCSRGARLRYLRADLRLLYEEAAEAAEAEEAEEEGEEGEEGETAEAVEAAGRATAVYAYLLPAVIRRLTPFLLRAIARGARVLTLEHHLPDSTDAEALSSLPPDCQRLTRFLVPVETQLYGRMRLYSSTSLGPLTHPKTEDVPTVQQVLMKPLQSCMPGARLPSCCISTKESA